MKRVILPGAQALAAIIKSVHSASCHPICPQYDCPLEGVVSSLWHYFSALVVFQESSGPAMFATPIVDYTLYGKLDAVEVSVSDLTTGKVK